MGEIKGGRGAAVSKSETSTGSVSSESSKRASGILLPTRPSLGRLKPARQEKRPGTTPQRRRVFICLSVGKYSKLFFSSLFRTAQSRTLEMNKYTCHLVSKRFWEIHIFPLLSIVWWGDRFNRVWTLNMKLPEEPLPPRRETGNRSSVTYTFWKRRF